MSTNRERFDVLIPILLLMAITDTKTEAKVVSRPSQRYVLDGHQGFLWCQNRSADDEQLFYSYVEDAQWHRWISNDTSQLIISTTNRIGVYSSGHTLIFHPTVREVDEGYYYCCTSDGNSCSDRTEVRISVPPIVDAVESRFVKAVGSATILLQCNILDPGIPQASFQWKKDGLNINNANIFTNDSFTSVTLFNLTEDDSGLYSCIGIGAYSYHSDSIELIIESPPYIRAIKTDYEISTGSRITLVCMIINPGEPRASFSWTKNGKSIDGTYPMMINDTFMSLTVTNVTAQDTGMYTCTASGIELYHSDSIQVYVASEDTSNVSESAAITVTIIAEGVSQNCSKNTRYIIESLSHYIQKSYGYNVTIIANSTKCLTNSKAIYYIEIISPLTAASLNETLQLLLNDLNMDGIHLGSITIKLCTLECTEIQSTSSSQKEDSKIRLEYIILTVAIFILMTILIALIYILYKMKTIVRLKQRLDSTSSKLNVVGQENDKTTPEGYTEILPHSKNKVSA